MFSNQLCLEHLGWVLSNKEGQTFVWKRRTDLWGKVISKHSWITQHQKRRLDTFLIASVLVQHTRPNITLDQSVTFVLILIRTDIRIYLYQKNQYWWIFKYSTIPHTHWASIVKAQVILSWENWVQVWSFPNPPRFHYSTGPINSLHWMYSILAFNERQNVNISGF